MGVLGFGSPFGVGGASTADELSSSPPGTAITTGDRVGTAPLRLAVPVENIEEGQAVRSDPLVSEYEIYEIFVNFV
jgi:hypothetical protein